MLQHQADRVIKCPGCRDSLTFGNSVSGPFHPGQHTVPEWCAWDTMLSVFASPIFTHLTTARCWVEMIRRKGVWNDRGRKAGMEMTGGRMVVWKWQEEEGEWKWLGRRGNGKSEGNYRKKREMVGVGGGVILEMEGEDGNKRGWLVGIEMAGERWKEHGFSRWKVTQLRWW